MSTISVSHLYRLRQSSFYRNHTLTVYKTKPVTSRYGERRRPDPQGQPGYVRVDTVHQGGRDGEKGVYHLNIVDAVSQWEIIGCVSLISERYLVPVTLRRGDGEQRIDRHWFLPRSVYDGWSPITQLLRKATITCLSYFLVSSSVCSSSSSVRLRPS